MYNKNRMAYIVEYDIYMHAFMAYLHAIKYHHLIILINYKIFR